MSQADKAIENLRKYKEFLDQAKTVDDLKTVLRYIINDLIEAIVQSDQESRETK